MKASPVGGLTDKRAFFFSTCFTRLSKLSSSRAHDSRSHSVVGTMLSACRLKLDRGKSTSLSDCFGALGRNGGSGRTPLECKDTDRTVT